MKHPTPQALSLVLFLVATGCGDSESAPVADRGAPAVTAVEEPESVEIATVDRAALSSRIAVSGSLAAARETEIGAESPGRILEVLVDVGDTVAAGQTLFRIDPIPYRTALAEAQAGLELAQSEHARAKAESERMRRLAEQNIVPEQRYEQHQTEAQVARARVAQMQARLSRAQLDLERTDGSAPYAGSIVERRVHEGSLAGPGTTILVLAETSRLEAILDVPEVTPAPVREGDPVRVWVEGVPRPIETKVERVNRRLDPETRTYAVRARVPDPEGQLKAGSYIRAEIQVRRIHPQPVVPQSALFTRDGRTYAVIVKNHRAHLVPVRGGLRVENRVEVLDGLNSGDVVVIGDDVERIQNGEALRVLTKASNALPSLSALEEPGS